MNEKKIIAIRKVRAIMRLTGAGVVAYGVHENCIYVLLGRERETPGWRQGSRKWSAFSGRLENNETPIQGASREFVEEACACVPVSESGSSASIQDVEKDLAARAHLFEQVSSSKTGERLIYHTFIVRIPYRPYHVMFQDIREQLLVLDGVFRTFYRLKKNADDVPRLFFPGFSVSAQLTVINFHVYDEVNVEIAMVETCNSEEQGDPIHMTAVVSVEIAKTLLDAELAWTETVRYIQEHAHEPIFQHPAVNITRLHGHVINAYVNKAFLEKCEIGWWKLDDLVRLQWDVWSSNYTAFRRLFLENISAVALEIQHLEWSRSGMSSEK